MTEQNETCNFRLIFLVIVLMLLLYLGAKVNTSRLFSTVDENDCFRYSSLDDLSDKDKEFVFKNWSCSCGTKRAGYLINKSDPEKSKKGLELVQEFPACFNRVERIGAVDRYLDAEAKALQWRTNISSSTEWFERLERFRLFGTQDLFNPDRYCKWDRPCYLKWENIPLTVTHDDGVDSYVETIQVSPKFFATFLRAKEMTESGSADERFEGFAILWNMERNTHAPWSRQHLRYVRKEAEWLTCAQIFAGDRLHLRADPNGAMQDRLLEKLGCRIQDTSDARFVAFVEDVIQANACPDEKLAWFFPESTFFRYKLVAFPENWILQRVFVPDNSQWRYGSWIRLHLNALSGYCYTRECEIKNQARLETTAEAYATQLIDADPIFRFTVELLFDRHEFVRARNFALKHWSAMAPWEWD